jgi:hypothetical protein
LAREQPDVLENEALGQQEIMYQMTMKFDVQVTHAYIISLAGYGM